MPASSDIDQERTPLVFIHPPRKRRGTLWTDAGVLFTPTPFKAQFPALHRISQAFRTWLAQFERVHARKDGPSPWDYWLEGGIRNVHDEVYALPDAMRALEGGQYFVHRGDGEGRIETLARMLRLRGYPVDPA